MRRKGRAHLRKNGRRSGKGAEPDAEEADAKGQVADGISRLDAIVQTPAACGRGGGSVGRGGRLAA